MTGRRPWMAAGALLVGALIGMPGLAPAAGDDDALLNALTESPGRTQPMLRVEWEAVPRAPAAPGSPARCTTTTGARRGTCSCG